MKHVFNCQLGLRRNTDHLKSYDQPPDPGTSGLASNAVGRCAMHPLVKLIATDQRRTLEFFFLGLRDLWRTVDRQELLYNASILAHYEQVPRAATEDPPTPADLGAVFDGFVLGGTEQHDRAPIEAAGAQCLLLAGFFEDQMRRRYNIRWYAELGATFFRQAASLSPRRTRRGS